MAAVIPGRGAAYAVTAACAGCGACLLTCPVHAIRPAGSEGLVVLDALCTRCGECVEVCPVDAIETYGTHQARRLREVRS